MPEVTVTIEGKEHKVDLAQVKLPDGHKLLTDDALRTGYVERSKVESDYMLASSVQDTIKERLKKHVQKEDASKDPDVVRAVLEAHKGKEIDLAATKQQWIEDELKPQKQLAESLLRRNRNSAINDAARAANFRDEYTTPMGPGKPSYLASLYADQFEYDSALDDFVVVRNGNRLGALDPDKSGRQHMNPEDFFTREAKSESMKTFLKPDEKNDKGPQYGRPRPGETPRGSEKAYYEKTRSERAQEYLDSAGSKQ